uniref:Uncharacterized protein n=1 Tax=Poecilia latipinna TaxID=48699 RepID=A0A3B3W1F7_9TELE
MLLQTICRTSMKAHFMKIWLHCQPYRCLGSRSVNVNFQKRAGFVSWLSRYIFSLSKLELSPGTPTASHRTKTSC